MKIRLLYIIIVLAFFAVQGKADVLAYSKERPLLFGIDLDYPPLEYIDETGKPQGYDIKFTKELMKRMGIPFTYSPNTWENIADDVLSGRVDLAMMVYSPYRKDATNYSRAVFRLYYQIVYRKDDKGDFDVRHLAGKSVAYMASRPIKDTLTKAGAVLHEIKNLTRATKDLAVGKYDAVICFRYQAKYMLDRYKLKNLVAEDLTLTPREYCYVSDDKALIDSINTVLDQMEEEGYITNIYGEVSSAFADFKVPEWVWYLLLMLVLVYLVAFIFFQKRYQQKLQREMHRAQRSEKMKSVFLGNVSHALRTPLNAIIGFSEVLDTEADATMSQKDRHQLLGLINSNGKQLLHYINQLLQLSEIEGNDIPLDIVKVRLAETMKACLGECRSEVAEGVQLRMEGPKAVVMADERYMRLVTEHFLNNAVKHTTQGSIVLRYSLVDNGLRVEVQDTGEGLPEALRENIFRLLSEEATFVQNEMPGLGLTISRTIIERCGGRIGAESPQEGGTILWYWIPVKVKK